MSVTAPPTATLPPLPAGGPGRLRAARCSLGSARARMVLVTLSAPCPTTARAAGGGTPGPSCTAQVCRRSQAEPLPHPTVPTGGVRRHTAGNGTERLERHVLGAAGISAPPLRRRAARISKNPPFRPTSGPSPVPVSQRHIGPLVERVVPVSAGFRLAVVQGLPGPDDLFGGGAPGTPALGVPGGREQAASALVSGGRVTRMGRGAAAVGDLADQFAVRSRRTWTGGRCCGGRRW